MNTKGRIFDIQRFSIHDGPGIRTIIFLKGCVLRCKWCCNPESQSYEIQQMNLNGETKTVGRDVTVADVIKEAEKDRAYYYRSGGGLTLSGGESLCQPEFTRDILRGAKENGINTALESTACASYDKIEEILPYLDTYLMDIKHINSEKHRKFTGRPNELILENAKKIAKSGLTNLVIRVPVIPGFNDTKKEIGDIARFASELEGVNKMHILPYHKFGIDKYKGIRRMYELMDIRPPSQTIMELLKAEAEKYGIECQIGG